MSSRSIIPHFERLAEIEKSAREFYGDLLLDLEDEKIKRLIEYIIEDEIRHVQWVEEAINILHRVK
jgi:rubrerythrin